MQPAWNLENNPAHEFAARGASGAAFVAIHAVMNRIRVEPALGSPVK